MALSSIDFFDLRGDSAREIKETDIAAVTIPNSLTLNRPLPSQAYAAKVYFDPMLFIQGTTYGVICLISQ